MKVLFALLPLVIVASITYTLLTASYVKRLRKCAAELKAHRGFQAKVTTEASAHLAFGDPLATIVLDHVSTLNSQLEEVAG